MLNRRFLFPFLLFVLSRTFVTPDESGPPSYDFLVINRTGYEIVDVHITHETDDNWGPNLLESDELIPGDGSGRIFSLEGLPTPLVDVLVVDEDGDRHTRYGVDVRQGALVFTLPGEIGGLVIHNTGDIALVAAYIRVSGSDDWGRNRLLDPWPYWTDNTLGEQGLAPGDSWELSTGGIPALRIDIRLVDSDGCSYTFEDRDAGVPSLSVFPWDLDSP